jgi:hypothetical protein
MISTLSPQFPLANGYPAVRIMMHDPDDMMQT